MLYELEATQHAKLAPLFRALDIHLATRAILEGSTHAQVWVDNPRNPQTALVRAGQRFFLTGRTHDDVFNDAVRRLYAETIYPQAIQAGNEMFTLYYAPDGWEYEMDVLLKDKFPMRRERQYYRFKKMKYDWRALLPDGFVLQFVNAALLESPQIKNLDALKEEMRSERASVEDFLAKSFGVIALHDNTLAGWCLSEYNCGSACEIGIATTEPYQKRGVATAMASAFVEHAHTRGITQIGWHCYTSNTPSVATALKVGFEKVRDYSVYLARFDETDNLTVKH